MTTRHTEMEKRILNAFETLRAAQGYTPSLKELAAACNMPLTTLQGHLEKMEAKGIVTREKRQPRSLTVKKED